jgi:DNA-binding Lrp family transcriptional regulator
MSFENFIGIDQKSLSDNINMPLPTVKKAMRELKESGMLLSIKNNMDTRRNDYRLNPIIGWKGKVTNRVKMLKENPNQIKMFEEQQEKHSLLPISKENLKEKNTISL